MNKEDREELYSALNEIKPKDKFVRDNLELPEEPIYNMQLEENDYIYKLLRNVSLLSEHFEKGTPVFSPKIVFSDGQRTFSEEDLCEKDYTFLSELDIKRLPLELQVKIADLLWKNKKNYKMAKFSVASYYQLYTDTFDTEHWTACIEYIKRSITLAQKIGDVSVRQTFLDNLFNKLVEVDGSGDPFFSICISNFLVQQKYNNLQPILNIMDKILQIESNIITVKKLFEVKKAILLILKDEEGLKNNYTEYAQFLESQSNISSDNKIRDLMKADSLLKEAVALYRNAGKSEEAERTHKKLLAIQDELCGEMSIVTDTFDVTEFYNHTKEDFKGLTFEEHIIILATICQFFSKDKIKESILSPDRFFSTRFFDRQKMDSHGRTVGCVPALGDNPTEKEMDERIYFELSRKAQLYGMTSLKWGTELINQHFDYSEDELEFIVRNNDLIPDNRKRIFITAIYNGLKGDLYVAIHILAPQMEALFRHYAWLLGSNTSTLDGNGIAEDKLLSSIFDDTILNEGYDEDILLTFRGLMNEKTGSNLRNKVAHGILDEEECNNGEALYFLCAVIKVLLQTSPGAYEINRNLSKKRSGNCNNSSFLNSGSQNGQ